MSIPGSSSSGKGGASSAAPTAATTTPLVGGGGPSVYDQSSAAFNQAGGLLGQAASMYQGAGPGAASTYRPSLMAEASSADPASIASGINKYMNPYTRQVIDRTSSDIQRMSNQQDAQTAASASGIGAFGGSRQGVVEALTRSEAQKNIGDVSAGLRSQGWNAAAGLAGQDIANQVGNSQFNASLLQQAAGQNANSQNTAKQFNASAMNQRDLDQMQARLASAGGLAGLSPLASGLGSSLFGVGQQINQDQMGAGSLQQQLMQQILTNASGQYDQAMGMPQNLLNMQLAALGMNPLTTATTTTGNYKPGLFDYLGLGAQALGAWRMGS